MEDVFLFKCTHVENEVTSLPMLYVLEAASTASRGCINHKDIRIASGEIKDVRREYCPTKEKPAGEAEIPSLVDAAPPQPNQSLQSGRYLV